MIRVWSPQMQTAISQENGNNSTMLTLVDVEFIHFSTQPEATRLLFLSTHLLNNVNHDFNQLARLATSQKPCNVQSMPNFSYVKQCCTEFTESIV
jgi:hypothetical protein